MTKRISKKDIIRIRKLDLFSYCLNYYPEELVKDSSNHYRLRSNHSCVMSYGKWNDFVAHRGGKSALDYLIYIENKDFKEAAHEILDLLNSKEPVINKTVQKREKPFLLPSRNENDNIAIRYLVYDRKINRKLVEYCIQKGMVYEDKYHNVVFVGYDDHDFARYAFKRSTLSNGKYDVAGSKKEYNFRLGNDKSETIHVFEAVIDLLSYITIEMKKGNEWNQDCYLALGGVGGIIPPALDYYLKDHNIKSIVLHLDNDEAGRLATKNIIESIGENYEMKDDHSKYKDFNEELIKTCRKRNREER